MSPTTYHWKRYYIRPSDNFSVEIVFHAIAQILKNFKNFGKILFN